MFRILPNQCLFQPNLKHTVFLAGPICYNIISLMAAVRFMCVYLFVPKGWVPICKYAEEMVGYEVGK